MNRFSLAQQTAYYTRFAFSTFILQRPVPIVGGLAITDTCNLDCRHCWRKNTGKGPATFEAIVHTMEVFFKKGVRYLYIQGGEPFTWQSEGHSLSDIVDSAKEIGFFHVAICTNGTFSLDPRPDTYWVSLDGLGKIHDSIRGGDTFKAVCENTHCTDHPNICANITINKENASSLEEILCFTTEESHFKGVMVNFHIPYPGVEHLLLDEGLRLEIAEQAIQLKRKGLNVLNSVSGLQALGRNTWPRPLRLSLVSDCESEYCCCRAYGRDEICRHCGYAVWAELSRILRPNLFECLSLIKQLHRLRVK